MKTLRTFQILLLAAAFALLAACGGSADSRDESQQSKQPDGVFDPLVETLDRAKSVQQTVDEQAAEQRRRIEKAEQGQSN